MVFRRSPPKRSPSPTPLASPAQKRAALESHLLLGEELQALRSAILQSKTGRTEETEALLSTSIQHWENLAQYLSTTTEAKYYNEIIPPQSSAAQRTLAVPELFEMIMDYLSVPSILAVAQTCREYKARIDNSQHMQVALCLRPAPADSPFCARFRTSLAHASGGGFYCKPPGPRSTNFGRIENGKQPAIDIGANFFPQGDGQRLPRIGPTYRRMFVTQPPIKEMSARVRCCRDVKEPIIRENGITIGDLYAFAAEAIEKHRWCPHEGCDSRILSNGQVHVLIEFSGKATLRCDDPIVKKYERERAERATEDKQRDVNNRRNAMYRSAKTVAHQSNLPIPTMPEWLEANPQWKTENVEEASRLERGLPPQAVMIPVDAFSFN